MQSCGALGGDPAEGSLVRRVLGRQSIAARGLNFPCDEGRIPVTRLSGIGRELREKISSFQELGASHCASMGHIFRIYPVNSRKELVRQ